MYENNTAEVKIGNEVSSWFCITSGVLSPYHMDYFGGLHLQENRKDNEKDNGIKLGGKNLLDSDYADGLSILDESVNKMNELLEFLRV